MSCSTTVDGPNAWIIDSRASDHMTTHLSNLESPKAITTNNHINLPTGATANITHTGTTVLSNGLYLTDVLCVPYFKHNLLSVQKLIKNSNFEVKFLPTHCIILDTLTQAIKAVGQSQSSEVFDLIHIDIWGPYKEPPQYDHLKVFGCLAFASNPTITSDKFAVRGVPCVFLGYPSLKKGYKLYNLITKTHFVSRDVTFQESVFPFQADSLQTYMSPLPIPIQTMHPVAEFDDTYTSLDNTEQTSPPLSPPYSENIHTQPSPKNSTPPALVMRRSTRPHKPPSWVAAVSNKLCHFKHRSVAYF
ncbi:uncharacterized protein LOC141679631 [Apium graveolens]|uniref:uncharacterized protein LOC141679631 n=1 Tax=Apium graveolens TaxID=4045 RepID=UPI003D7B5ED1